MMTPCEINLCHMPAFARVTFSTDAMLVCHKHFLDLFLSSKPINGNSPLVNLAVVRPLPVAPPPMA